MKIQIIIYSILALSFLTCNTKTEKIKEQPNKIESKEQVTKESNDTIYISTSMQGQPNRMNILQQKVMFRAKKKLADSITMLQQLYGDSANYNPDNYEITLHDIHVVNEGFRYPKKNDQSTIEAYITIAMKYKAPIPKLPHKACER